MAQLRYKFLQEACLDSRYYQILGSVSYPYVRTPHPSSVLAWDSLGAHLCLLTVTDWESYGVRNCVTLIDCCIPGTPLCLTPCSIKKKIGAQSITLEMKILKPTFCYLLRPQSSLATIVVVSSPDFSTKLVFKFPLCYLLALSLSFLFYKMGDEKHVNLAGLGEQSEGIAH